MRRCTATPPRGAAWNSNRNNKNDNNDKSNIHQTNDMNEIWMLWIIIMIIVIIKSETFSHLRKRRSRTNVRGADRRIGPHRAPHHVLAPTLGRLRRPPPAPWTAEPDGDAPRVGGTLYLSACERSAPGFLKKGRSIQGSRAGRSGRAWPDQLGTPQFLFFATSRAGSTNVRRNPSLQGPFATELPNDSPSGLQAGRAPLLGAL